REFDADYSSQAFADVIARKVLFDVFEQSRLLTVVVNRTSQRAAESAEVSSTVNGVDVVCEAENTFGVSVVVLERDFHGQRATVRQVARLLEINRLAAQPRFPAIQLLDESRDTAAIVKLALLDGIDTLVGQPDRQPFVQERQLA